ncbi:MAG: nuclear transport factor 2 family protein [Sphingomonadales bacterium]|nr:nuclear transport factor 2 family protein [Sphingomonadales bacterium]
MWSFNHDTFAGRQGCHSRSDRPLCPCYRSAQLGIDGTDFPPRCDICLRSGARRWRDFVGQATAIIESCIATHHQLGQMIIVPQGPDAAIAETYMTAMHIVPAGYPLTAVFPDRGEEYSAIIAGRYVDQFVRFGEEWRILKRTGIYDWREFRAIGEASLASVPAAARGAHDESDAASGIARYWQAS